MPGSGVGLKADSDVSPAACKKNGRSDQKRNSKKAKLFRTGILSNRTIRGNPINRAIAADNNR
jgi:hypothetical protein